MCEYIYSRKITRLTISSGGRYGRVTGEYLDGEIGASIHGLVFGIEQVHFEVVWPTSKCSALSGFGSDGGLLDRSMHGAKHNDNVHRIHNRCDPLE